MRWHESRSSTAWHSPCWLPVSMTAADPAGMNAGETEESVSTRSPSRSRSSPCLTALETLYFPSSKLAYNYVSHNVVLWVILLSVKLDCEPHPRATIFYCCLTVSCICSFFVNCLKLAEIFSSIFYLFFLNSSHKVSLITSKSIHFGTSVEKTNIFLEVSSNFWVLFYFFLINQTG